MDIRAVCIQANEQFAIVSEDTGLALEQIDVGTEPNDCTGDTIEGALIKTFGNLVLVLSLLTEKLQ
jgi:hypothetical protein